jgi:hypothetical protein
MDWFEIPPPKKKREHRDAFPRRGRVAKYKPFILAETKKYRFYGMRFADMVDEAVRLAKIANKRFEPDRINPATGRPYDFSTFLRWHLRGLHRYAQRCRRKREPEGELEDWEVENIRREQKRENERLRTMATGWSPDKPPADAEVTLIRGRPNRRGGSYAKWKKKNAKKLPALAKVAAGLRMKNEKQCAVRDWMVGDMLGRETRTQMQAAAEIKIGRSYMSKVLWRISRRISH